MPVSHYSKTVLSPTTTCFSVPLLFLLSSLRLPLLLGLPPFPTTGLRLGLGTFLTCHSLLPDTSLSLQTGQKQNKNSLGGGHAWVRPSTAFYLLHTHTRFLKTPPQKGGKRHFALLRIKERWHLYRTAAHCRAALQALLKMALCAWMMTKR